MFLHCFFLNNKNLKQIYSDTKKLNFFFLSSYKRIYIYIYVVPSITFQTYFVQAFKIVVDSCYYYTSYEMTDQFS